MDALSARKSATFPLDEPFRKRFGNPYAVVHRADLHGVLLDGLPGQRSDRAAHQHA